MEINQFFKDGLLDIHIHGDLDASTSLQLDDVFVEALNKQQTKILVNCRKLHYISSAGLGVFISHLEDIRFAGGNLILYEMNEAVLNTFNILGLNAIMIFTDTEENAKLLIHES